MIGNSKNLWPKFIFHLKENETWLDTPHPLERYTEHFLKKMLTKISKVEDPKKKIKSSIFFSHHIQIDKMVHFQKLAHISNLAHYSPEAYLNIHNKYGPWFAMRAAIGKKKLIEKESFVYF